MTIATNCFLLATSIVIFSGCVSKQENIWPQFRGTNSLGIAPESATPPLELNPDKNLSWKTTLASGVSSPCVYKNMVFITGFDTERKALITYCVDFEKGTVLWQKLVLPDSIEQGHSVSSPAATTPVTDGLAVYVYFGSYGALCYDFSGNLLWEHKMPVLDAMYGTCGSPVIHDSLMLINRVNRIKPSLLAINKHNGQIVWEHFMTLAPGLQEHFSVSHSTPVIWRDQVILHRTLELSSLFLIDGSEAWSMGVVTTGVGTPVIVNDTLYLNGFLNMGESRLFDELPDFNAMLLKYDSNHDKLVNISEIPSEWAFYRRPELDLSLGYDAFYPIRDLAISFALSEDKSLSREEWEKLRDFQESCKLEHGTIALKLEDSKGINNPSMIWKQKEYVSEVPSLLVANNRVYMITDGGTFTCFNASKGDLVFRERIKAPGPYIASPLYANGYIYLIAYNGKVSVVKPGDKLNIVSRSDLKENVAASPVALNNLLLVRTKNALYAFKN